MKITMKSTLGMALGFAALCGLSIGLALRGRAAVPLASSRGALTVPNPQDLGEVLPVDSQRPRVMPSSRKTEPPPSHRSFKNSGPTSEEMKRMERDGVITY